MKTLMIITSILALTFSLSAFSRDEDKTQERSHSNFQQREIPRAQSFESNTHADFRTQERMRGGGIEDRSGFRNDFRFRDHDEHRHHNGSSIFFPSQIYIQTVQPNDSDCCYWDGGNCGCEDGVAVCCDGELIPDCDCF